MGGLTFPALFFIGCSLQAVKHFSSFGRRKAQIGLRRDSCHSRMPGVVNLYHIRNALVVFAFVAAVGFVALLFGVKLVPQWKFEREQAFLSRDPERAAEEDFARGELRFVRVFSYRWEGERRVGEWRLPAEDRIAKELLLRYQERRDLDSSIRLEMSLDQDDARRRMELFVYEYNLQAARLLGPATNGSGAVLE